MGIPGLIQDDIVADLRIEVRSSLLAREAQQRVLSSRLKMR